MDDTLPDIEGDAAQLNQIFLNLVINASEAMGQTGGTIVVRTLSGFLSSDYFSEAYTEATLAPGKYVMAKVTDTGSGMTRETLKQIFDHMPGLGGVAIMDEIKRIRFDVPIILSSGYSATEDLDITSDGYTAFLPKPDDFTQLNELLARVLK